MKISIVIPAYNEAKRLPRTLDSLERYFHTDRRVNDVSLHEVIIVDDGSEDETSSVAQAWKDRLSITCVRLPKNKGKGAAMKTGMAKVSGDYALLYDADGATHISEIEKLIGAMKNNGADIAIGSRTDKKLVVGGKSRRFFGSVYQRLCQALIPGIHDANCGFKLFHSNVAQYLFPQLLLNRFVFDVELLSLALQEGFEITEVPVSWSDMPDSKVRVMRDTVESLFSVGILYAAFLFKQLNRYRTGIKTSTMTKPASWKNP